MYKIIGGDGKEYGPVTVEQIREWLAAGRANFDTQARPVDQESWSRLGDLPEFAGNVPPPLGAAATTDTLAGRWVRFGAAFIDFVISCACFAPGMVAIIRYAMEVGAARGTRIDPSIIFGLPGVRTSIIAGCAVLVIQALLLSLRGQTLGKLVTGIHIVRLSDGKTAGFVHAFLLRGVVLEVVYVLINLVPIVGGLVVLAARLVDICFIFREDRRCLHDLIAGTRVNKVPS